MELLKTMGKTRTAITADATALDVAITAEHRDYDCVSRYFAPANGIPEDPVTGSIHTGIIPIWAEQLGKDELVAYQASQRGGSLYCKMLDDERIEISGYARLFMQAELASSN
jgi:predicted PhzF superfamily epimerase YddE/YHI9